MRKLWLWIILIPAVELAILLISGKTIGIMATFLLIFATGGIGVWLAKRQGMETVRKIQTAMNYGQPPGNELLDAVCILAGGFLLLLPGFISDLLGLILLIPITRSRIKPFVIRYITNRMNRGKITIIR